MNYIDINSLDAQELNMNINLDDYSAISVLILWTIYKEGSDTPVAVIDNSGGFAAVTSHGYHHKLTLDLAQLVFDEDLVDETQYTIEGLYNGSVVYKGKFQTTSKDISDYSVNTGKYVKQNTTNNYTILE